MARRQSRERTYEIWPGFVDALTTLLLVIIFLLVVFVLAQFFLSQALSGRDAALEKLNIQVNELADLLALERQNTADLKLNLQDLTVSLEQANKDRDSAFIQLDTLTSRVSSVEEERDQLVLLLRAEEKKVKDAVGKLASSEASLTEAQTSLDKSKAALASLEETTRIDKDTIAANLKELESLKRDILALKETRTRLESDVSTLAAKLKLSDEQILELTAKLDKGAEDLSSMRDRSKELEAKLADELEKTVLSQKEVKDRDIRLAELQALYLQTQDSLTTQETISAKAQSQVKLLNAQISALRQQLARIEDALEVSEAKDINQNAQIADLGRRLNQALARKVQELQQYRSDFFGRLRQVLKNRPGISIVGDRFVFQSEVLFGLGEAELGTQGRENMARFAATLLDIAADIPKEVDWILRVDGHTDRQPINTVRFPSNWELSMARALSVTKYLIGQGVAANRLAPTGFGEFQPLDPRKDEIAYLRNRRIELKLTER